MVYRRTILTTKRFVGFFAGVRRCTKPVLCTPLYTLCTPFVHVNIALKPHHKAKCTSVHRFYLLREIPSNPRMLFSLLLGYLTFGNFCGIIILSRVLDKSEFIEVTMIIKEYQRDDCKEIIELFYNTIHAVNAKDYTEEQLNAWASGNVNMEHWNRSLQEHFSLVAFEDKIIVGFGVIDSTGYLDRLYVHKDFQRKGIATALCEELERAVSCKITTYASITAKPFFENRGYKVITEQQVNRQNVLLTNFVMEKVKEF